VLDFFGPTCEACRKALPALYAKRAELEAHGAQLVLIAVLADGESSDAAQRALTSWGVRASFLVDSQGTGRREAGVTALPTTMVIDTRGVVSWVARSGATAEQTVAAAE
jgi:thiol-disulfide isomerase/thioredoxin